MLQYDMIVDKSFPRENGSSSLPPPNAVGPKYFLSVFFGDINGKRRRRRSYRTKIKGYKMDELGYRALLGLSLSCSCPPLPLPFSYNSFLFYRLLRLFSPSLYSFPFFAEIGHIFILNRDDLHDMYSKVSAR